MKKNTALFILLIFSFSLLLYACVVETHPKVPPPPPKREIVLRCAPGFVWVPGHWAWKHGRYVWVPGHCKKARKGYVWVPGHWEKRGRVWVWIPGHWRKI